MYCMSVWECCKYRYTCSNMWYTFSSNTLSWSDSSICSWWILSDQIMWKTLIHIRTRLDGSHQSEWWKVYRHGRSTEVGWIRSYIISDDPRDIAWHRWAHINWLYTKERESSIHPWVYSISLFDRDYLDIIGSDSFSKREYIEDFIHIMRENSRSFHYPYTSLTRRDELMNIEKSVVFIIGGIEHYSEFPTLIWPMIKNDIIFIELTHTEEHTGNTYFLSHIGGKKYSKAVEIERKKWMDFAQAHSMDILHSNCHDDIVLLLNHFFKYRYV